jgi:hypothetical protein
LDVAPQEEVAAITGKSRRITPTSISDIAPDAKTMKSIRSFAEEHPFREQDKWTDAELQEYKDDVYEFATAAGMSDLHADLEVSKATGAWKSEKGLPLDNNHQLKVKKTEQANHAKPVVADVGLGDRKKRKRELLDESLKFSNFAKKSEQSPPSVDAISLETRSDDRDSIREAKRRRKSEKKARRRARKRAKELGLSAASESKPLNSKPHHGEGKEPALLKKKPSIGGADSKPTSSGTRPTAAEHITLPLPSKKAPKASQPILQSPQSYYAHEKTASPKNITRDNISISTTDEQSVGLALKKKRREKVEKKKLKKKAKLGPKTSEYFGKSKPSGLPFSTTLKDDIESTPITKHVVGTKPQCNYGEEMRQLQVATKLEAKAAKAGRGVHPNRFKNMAEEAKQAVKNAPVLVKEVSTEKKCQKASSKMKTEPEAVEKKKNNRNRKRHRNKNRLLEKQSGENGDSGNVAIQDEDEIGRLPSKKGRDISRKLNAIEGPDKAQDADLTAPKESIMQHENSGDPIGDQIVSKSATATGDHGVRSNKRRGRRRKSKSKKGGLEMPDVGESAVAEPAAADPDVLLESVERSELSVKKKRKHSKSKSREENIESGEVGGSAAVNPLIELADTNSKKSKEGRRGLAHKRVVSVDAMDLDIRPSNQSSKAHHSQ